MEQLMTNRGVSPESLAARSGVPLKSIYGYLKGDVSNPRGDVLARIAQALGTSEAFLRFGTVSAQPAELRKIALIPLSSLASINDPCQVLSQWDGVTEVVVPHDIMPGCYAIEITDESGGAEFRPGDVLVCDPHAEIEPGRVVVAVIPSANLAVFGRFKPASRTTPAAGFTIVHAGADYPPTTSDASAPGFVVARAVRHIRHI